MGFESWEGGNRVKQTHPCGAEVWGETGHINSLCSDLRFYQDNIPGEGFLASKYQQEQQQRSLWDFEILDDLYLDIVSPPFQSCEEEITKFVDVQIENSEPVEAYNERPSAFPSTSLGILKNYGGGIRRLKEEKTNVPAYDTAYTKSSGRKLSTEEIMRLAGEKFIQFSSQRTDDLCLIGHPFDCSFLGLSNEETRDVELVQYLLASAEKVGQQQFDRASKLLNHCDQLSSSTGNPVQRVVYYFSEALREKINIETGRIRSKDLGKKHTLDLEEAVRGPNLTLIAFHQKVPFIQVCQFTGMQAILESVAEAKKVHIIDLEIRGGTHCTVLMQALAAQREYPTELLKITAVGTESKAKIEDIGKQLISFAQSMNLPFSFNVVMVSDMLDLNEDLFELDAEEAVVVYSPYILRTMIARPDRLERLMSVMRNINPCITVVAEIEANHNSPVFVSRFLEAFFYYGAFFESLEDCMDQDPHRMISESYVFHAIRNIVAAEGEERMIRHVNINVWRAFFARSGMTEIELSTSSLYQASLLVSNFACGSSCTLVMDGKCLTIGWKGTPIYSLSAWKFK
ncbi:DELLA protein RGL1-like isoform X2 [Cornus florida]|uniref:DELLA protein RGL1-like isoform X2 n=1 Tax=Cornus florida TaxID=4283 RepID=UPI002898B2D7|nr:DELLA protein RGL1-like isoform X2 [Cornus florida]